MKFLFLICMLWAFNASVMDVYAVESGANLAKSKGCVDCHGETGISENPIVPNLAGQKFKYLRKQIEMFQTDGAQEFEGERISERHHPAMSNTAQNVTKAELNRIIHHYSKLDCKVPAKKQTARVIPEAKRCEICHGGVRTSPFRDSPNLAGQKEFYMLKQIRLMIASMESANAVDTRYHRLTELMVEGLSDDDLVKATKYYADMGCE